MTLKTNPFASYGPIVWGKRFIGRVNAIRIVRQRVVADDPGCLAIVGLPRIGKSSLAYQCLIHQRTALHTDKIVPVWIDMGTFKTPHAFFQRLILSTQGALEEVDGLTERIKSKAALALEADCPWMEFNHRTIPSPSEIEQPRKEGYAESRGDSA